MAYIPGTIAALVQPSVYALATRLFVLTTGRAGSTKFKPTVSTFYETSIVTAIYEHLLMSPDLAHLDIRHEMPFPGAAGRPKQVDLWLRPVNGGYAHCIEAGDFGVGKAHADAAKLRSINPKGSNWFLAFFRGESEAKDPFGVLETSFKRTNGLDDTQLRMSDDLTGSFNVYRPNGAHSPVGYSLLRVL